MIEIMNNIVDLLHKQIGPGLTDLFFTVVLVILPGCMLLIYIFRNPKARDYIYKAAFDPDAIDPDKLKEKINPYDDLKSWLKKRNYTFSPGSLKTEGFGFELHLNKGLDFGIQYRLNSTYLDVLNGKKIIYTTPYSQIIRAYIQSESCGYGFDKYTEYSLFIEIMDDNSELKIIETTFDTNNYDDCEKIKYVAKIINECVKNNHLII